MNCIECGRPHRNGGKATGNRRCRACIDADKYELIYDPADTYRSGVLWDPGIWNFTREAGYWPPGSIWYHDRQFWIIVGGVYEKDDLDVERPQRLKPIGAGAAAKLVGLPARRRIRERSR